MGNEELTALIKVLEQAVKNAPRTSEEQYASIAGCHWLKIKNYLDKAQAAIMGLDGKLTMIHPTQAAKLLKKMKDNKKHC